MPFFRQLVFRVDSQPARRASRRRAEALPGVTVLSCHWRSLGMLERPRLWQPQWEVRMVVEIERRHRTLAPRPAGQAVDPYRASFETFIHGTRPDINELIKALGAEHSEVNHGTLTFESEPHTEALCEALRATIEAACEGHRLHARLQQDVEGATLLTNERALAGRVHGAVPGIKVLHRLLLDSPLIDDDRISVRYVLRDADANP